MQKFILECTWRNIEEDRQGSRIFHIDAVSDDEARKAAERALDRFGPELGTAGVDFEGLTGMLYREIPLTVEEPAPIIRCIP
jgi:hypothetical protein